MDLWGLRSELAVGGKRQLEPRLRGSAVLLKRGSSSSRTKRPFQFRDHTLCWGHSRDLYIYIYICVSISICRCIFIYTHVGIQVQMCACICIHVHILVYMKTQTVRITYE